MERVTVENDSFNVSLGAPPEHNERLKNKLRCGNELTLHKRMRNLLESFPYVKSVNVGQFIEDVVNTRNNLTHYDTELEKLSTDPEKMACLL